MAVIFQANLRNLKKRVKGLTIDLTPNMRKTGFKAIDLVMEKWDKKKGADGKALDKLTPAYKKRKLAKGRKGIPNFQFSGKLRQAMFVAARGGEALVTFRGGERGKARGNAEHRENMMKPGRKLTKDLTDFFFKLIT